MAPGACDWGVDPVGTGIGPSHGSCGIGTVGQGMVPGGCDGGIGVVGTGVAPGPWGGIGPGGTGIAPGHCTCGRPMGKGSPVNIEPPALNAMVPESLRLP
jgi:hypothetical protein